MPLTLTTERVYGPFDMVATLDELYVVCWGGDHPDPPPGWDEERGQDIFCSVLDNDAQLVHANIIANEGYSHFRQFWPRCQVMGDGNVVVVWTGDAPDLQSRCWGQVVDPRTGELVGDMFRFDDGGDEYMYTAGKPDVDVLLSGDILVSYREVTKAGGAYHDYNLFVRRVAPNGTMIDEVSKSMGDDVTHHAMCALVSRNGYVLATTSASSSAVTVQSFYANGQPISPPVQTSVSITGESLIIPIDLVTFPAAVLEQQGLASSFSVDEERVLLTANGKVSLFKSINLNFDSTISLVNANQRGSTNESRASGSMDGSRFSVAWGTDQSTSHGASFVGNLPPRVVGSFKDLALVPGHTADVKFGPLFEDPEGLGVTISATLADGSSLPSWIELDVVISSEQWKFTIAPSNQDRGRTKVWIIGTDPDGASSHIEFNIDVANAAPEPTSEPIAADLSVGVPWRMTFSPLLFEDSDGDRLSLDVSLSASQASWLRKSKSDNGSLALSGTPVKTITGTVQLSIEASDPFGGTGSLALTLTVTPSLAVTGLGDDDEYTEDAMSSLTEWARDVSIVANASDSKVSVQVEVDPLDSAFHTGDSLAVATSSIPSSVWSYSTSTRQLTTNDLVSTHDAAVILRSLAYQPLHNYDQPVVLHVTIGDGGKNADITHRVNVSCITQEDPPSVNGSLATRSVFIGDTATVHIPGNLFGDPDTGDALHIVLVNSPEFVVLLAHEGHELIISPQRGDQGKYTVSIAAVDMAGLNATTSFQLSVPNRKPKLRSPLADRTTEALMPFAFDIDPSLFQDEDGDEITVEVKRTGTAQEWTTWSPTTGVLSGRAPVSAVGSTAGVDITASDGLDSTTVSVAITVEPSLTLEPASQNRSYSEDNVFFFSSLDTIRRVDESNATTATLTLALEPASAGTLVGEAGAGWSSHDDATSLTVAGEITSVLSLIHGVQFHPALNSYAQCTVRMTMVDEDKRQGEAALLLTGEAVNDKPQSLRSLPDQRVRASHALRLDLEVDTLFEDPDVGDWVCLSARNARGSSLPIWLTLVQSPKHGAVGCQKSDSYSLRGTPLDTDVGVFNVELLGTDQHGEAASILFAIEVDPPASTSGSDSGSGSGLFSTTHILGVVLGGVGSALIGLLFWCFKSNRENKRAREAFPLANRLRSQLGLHISSFTNDKGHEYVMACKLLAEECATYGYDTSTMSRRELDVFALFLSDAILEYVKLEPRCCALCSCWCKHRISAESIRDSRANIAQKLDQLYRADMGNYAARQNKKSSKKSSRKRSSTADSVHSDLEEPLLHLEMSGVASDGDDKRGDI